MSGNVPGPDRDGTADASEIEASDEADRRLREMLRGYGLRRTEQRLAVLHLFAGDGHTGSGHPVHLTATQVHDRLRAADGTADLSTVYRTLSTLVNLGVLHAIAYADQPTSYGLASATHHHAVCARCGAVADIPAEILTATLIAVYEATGYRSAHPSVAVNALCEDCQRESA